MSVLETFYKKTRDNLFYGNITSARYTTNPLTDSTADNVTTNNPTLNPPNVIGLRFFGQSPITPIVRDHILPKPVGQYPSNVHGSGLQSFRFSNDPLFRGNNPLAYSFGVMSLGSQFVNIPGASSLISGGMASVLSSSVKSLITNLLPSSIPQFPFQSEILGLMDNASLFSPDLVNSLNSLISASAGSLTSGSNASFIPTLYQIGNLLTKTINNLSINEISNEISAFTTSLNQYKSGLVTSGLASLISTDPTSYLNSIIDENISTMVPGGSTIIRSLFTSTSNLSNIIGGNVYENVDLAKNSDIAITLISKTSAVFSNSTQPTVSNDEISKGQIASNEVLEILRKIKNNIYDNTIANVWDEDNNIPKVSARSYTSDGLINIENSRRI